MKLELIYLPHFQKDMFLQRTFLSEANDLQSPEGIAIDWLSRHVYWVDSGKRTIEVANMESKKHKILVDSCDVCDYDNCCLKKPRGLAVDPSSR